MFARFLEGGGSSIFQVVHLLISMNTYRTCDLPEGWRSGRIHSDPHMFLLKNFIPKYFFTLCYKKSARDQSHDICRLELGKIEKYDVVSETQFFVLTNNLRCFDETDVRTSQKTTNAQFKIYRTNFINEIGPRLYMVIKSGRMYG